MNQSDWIAYWGAALSTALGALRAWEVVRDRPRLTTTYTLTNSPEHPNEVVIINTGKVPALVNYWELTWAHRWGIWTRFERFEELPEDGRCDMTIPAHGRSTILFGGARWFNTRTEVEGHPVKLYLKLAVAGRKGWVWLKVWGGRGS